MLLDRAQRRANDDMPGRGAHGLHGQVRLARQIMLASTDEVIE
jgi:hypothetical protein